MKYSRRSVRRANGRANVKRNRKRKKRNNRRWFSNIQKLQKSTNLLIPKISFRRLVIEYMQQLNWKINIDKFNHIEAEENLFRLQSLAAQALHEAAEQYLVKTFEDANRLAISAKRVTVNANDIFLSKRILTGEKLKLSATPAIEESES